MIIFTKKSYQLLRMYVLVWYNYVISKNDIIGGSIVDELKKMEIELAKKILEIKKNGKK